MSPDEKGKPRLEPPAALSPSVESKTSQAGMTEAEQQAADAALMKRLSQVWPPIWPTPAESHLTKMEADWAARRRAGHPAPTKPLESMTDGEIDNYLIDCLYADVELEEQTERDTPVSKPRPPEAEKK